jgi:hypothetical protein
VCVRVVIDWERETTHKGLLSESLLLIKTLTQKGRIQLS